MISPPAFRRRPDRLRRGFTLVALMVAMVLLTVGMITLAGANAQTATMQSLSQNRTNAIAIARAYMEQVHTRDPWTIVSEGPTNVDGEGWRGIQHVPLLGMPDQVGMVKLGHRLQADALHHRL